MQERLRPANLAGEAWDGVKEKSANIADDAVDAVKQRPGTVSLVLGAIALFLARKPIARAVGGLISRGDDETGAKTNRRRWSRQASQDETSKEQYDGREPESRE